MRDRLVVTQQMKEGRESIVRHRLYGEAHFTSLRECLGRRSELRTSLSVLRRAWEG